MQSFFFFCPGRGGASNSAAQGGMSMPGRGAGQMRGVCLRVRRSDCSLPEVKRRRRRGRRQQRRLGHLCLSGRPLGFTPAGCRASFRLLAAAEVGPPQKLHRGWRAAAEEGEGEEGEEKCEEGQAGTSAGAGPHTPWGDSRKRGWSAAAGLDAPLKGASLQDPPAAAAQLRWISAKSRLQQAQTQQQQQQQQAQQGGSGAAAAQPAPPPLATGGALPVQEGPGWAPEPPNPAVAEVVAAAEIGSLRQRLEAVGHMLDWAGMPRDLEEVRGPGSQTVCQLLCQGSFHVFHRFSEV